MPRQENVFAAQAVPVRVLFLEADFGARKLLHPCRPRLARRLVAGQRRMRIVGIRVKPLGQNIGVLEGHVGALPEGREHGMGGIAEQGHAALGPLRRVLACELTPFRAGRRRPHHPAELVAGMGEGRQHFIDAARHRPRLLRPARLLPDAYEIDELALPDVVADDEPAIAGPLVHMAVVIILRQRDRWAPAHASTSFPRSADPRRRTGRCEPPSGCRRSRWRRRPRRWCRP